MERGPLLLRHADGAGRDPPAWRVVPVSSRGQDGEVPSYLFAPGVVDVERVALLDIQEVAPDPLGHVDYQHAALAHRAVVYQPEEAVDLHGRVVGRRNPALALLSRIWPASLHFLLCRVALLFVGLIGLVGLVGLVGLIEFIEFIEIIELVQLV